MLSILRQLKPLNTVSPYELAHTPAMPWLVRAVRTPEYFRELMESDISLTVLEPFGPDPWVALQLSPVIDPASVATSREALEMDPDHTAFYPLAVLSHEGSVDLGLPCSISASELSRQSETMLSDLAEGLLRPSPRARAALGDGTSRLLPDSLGVGTLALMELELTQGATLLGWGWLWQSDNRKVAQERSSKKTRAA